MNLIRAPVFSSYCHSMPHLFGNPFLHRGPPEQIRSGSEPGFVAQTVRDWLGHPTLKTPNIEPGSPGENGYCLRFGDPGQAARQTPEIEPLLTITASRAYTETAPAVREFTEMKTSEDSSGQHKLQGMRSVEP